MADKLSLKLEVDATQSIQTIDSLEKELAQLKTTIKGVGVGSEEFKKLQTQIVTTESKVKNLNKSIEGLDTEAIAGEWGKFAGGVSAGIGAIALAAGGTNQSLEKVLKTVATTMAVVQGFKGVTEAFTAAQKLLNVEQLKSTVIGIKDAAVKTAQAVATGVVTAAQWLWNTAMAANPIGAVIAGVTALIAGITLLVKWLKKSSDATEENSKAEAEANVKRLSALKDRLDAEGSTAAEIYKVQKELLENELKLLDKKSEEYTKKYNELIKLNREYAEQKKKDDIENVKAFGESELTRIQIAGATEEEIYRQKVKNIEELQKQYNKGSDDWNKLELNKINLTKDYEKQVSDAKKEALEKQIQQEKDAADEIQRLKIERARGTTDAEVKEAENRAALLEAIGIKYIQRIEAIQPTDGKTMAQRFIGGFAENEADLEALVEYANEKGIELNDINEGLLKERLSFTEENYQAELDALNDLHSKGVLSHQQYLAKKQQLDERYNKWTIQSTMVVAATTLGYTAQLFGEIAEFYKDDVEKYKRMQKAKVIMDAAAAIIGTWAGYANMSVVGTVLAGIQTAFIAAMAVVQIAKINSTQFAKGGILEGPSHSNGGILTPYGEVEGGEGVINKNSMSNPDLRNLASAVNVAGGGRSFGTGDGSINLSPSSIAMIVSGISAGVNSKKVYVVESDISEVQKKVSIMEQTAIL